MVKTIIGLLVAFSLGVVCRVYGIPSPAPPLVMGALLVMAMTVGYILMDRLMRRWRHQSSITRESQS
jgi:XapX domain-containing protein